LNKKYIIKSSILTRKSRAKLGENYSFLNATSLLFKKKFRRKIRNSFKKDTNEIEELNNEENLNLNSSNLIKFNTNNTKIIGDYFNFSA